MRFLVDVNLPNRFSYFNNDSFEFVIEIDRYMPDTDIWKYAIDNQLVILTKDTDFYHRALMSNKRPKVIHFKLGNHSLKQLHDYFSINWSALLSAIQNHDLIVAYSDSFECIF